MPGVNLKYNLRSSLVFSEPMPFLGHAWPLLIFPYMQLFFNVLVFSVWPLKRGKREKRKGKRGKNGTNPLNPLAVT